MSDIITCILLPVLRESGVIGKPKVVKLPRKNFNRCVYDLIDTDIYDMAPVMEHRDYQLIVDDCGLLKDLPCNLYASMLYNSTSLLPQLVGDALLVKVGKCDGEMDVISMEDSDVTRWMQKLYTIFDYIEGGDLYDDQPQ